MNAVGRVVVVIALIGLLVTAGLVVSGVASAEGGLEVDENETVRHHNPAEYGASGDQDGTAEWLSGELSRQLGDSAIALEEGEYELANELLDEEYHDRLEQYVEVGSDEPSDEDDEMTASELFEQLGDDQDEFSDNASEYNETKSEYDDARDAGEEARAFELARDLEGTAVAIERQNESIVRGYERLEDKTGEDFSEPIDAVTSVTESILSEHATVRNEQFIETTLQLEAADDEISTREPLEVGGELRTAGGNSVSDEDGDISLGPREVDGELSGDGTVSGKYRPLTDPLSTEELSIRYEPSTDSPYLGTETTVPVSITQTDAELRDLEATTQAGYNDQLSVEGNLTTTGDSLDEVPLTTSLGNHDRETITVENGSFAETITVPAAVPTGTQTLEVAFPHDDRALGPTAATQNVTVTETESTLTADAEWVNESAIDLTAVLETDDGDGIEEQTIDIQVDGTVTETATTDSDGEATTPIVVPADPTDPVELTATYDGTETNIASATAETTVQPLQGSSGPVGSGWLLAGGAAVGVVLIVCTVWWYRHRLQMRSSATTSSNEPASDSAETDIQQPIDPRPQQPLIETILEQAHEEISAGQPDEAVRTCYTAVRAVCEHQLDTDRPDTLTHREFYRQYRNTDDDTPMLAITEAYEKAAFTPEALSRTDARDVLAIASELCGYPEMEAETGTEPTAADD